MYTVRELIVLSEDSIWGITPGLHTVVFDNESVEMNERQIIFSWYYWRLHREFPGAQIPSTHALTGSYTSKVHDGLTALMFWDIIRDPKGSDDVWGMSKVLYEITNAVYNMVCIRLSAYVTTGSLYDLVEVLDEPNIKQAKIEYMETVTEASYDSSVTEEAIRKVHGVVANVMYDSKDSLPGNGIKLLCDADVLSKGQLLQLIGPRGYVHDIDGGVFKYPIDVGYAEGLRTLYDSSIESRSATRALHMNTAPLKQSEYFNRRMQLLASAVNSVTTGSCDRWLTIPHMVVLGDLKLLKGKYHMVGDEPVLIWDTIEDIVGTVINLRTITGCGNADVQTVCSTCAGAVATLIPPTTNFGYYIITSICQVITQMMLSTKHLEVSQAAIGFALDTVSSKFFKLNSKHEGKVFLNKLGCRSNLVMRIPDESVVQLNSILTIDVSELPPSRISECKYVEVLNVDANGVTVETSVRRIDLTVSGTGCCLTNDVLLYLKSVGWERYKGYIEFQLNDWDIELPIFNIPQRGDDMMLFLNTIKDFMMTGPKAVTRITDYRTRGAAVSELVILLRKKLNINFIQAEIFIRACMVRDPAIKDYTLPHIDDDFSFISAKKCITYRSLGTMFAYQEQFTPLVDPVMFNPDNKLSTNMMDRLIKQ